MRSKVLSWGLVALVFSGNVTRAGDMLITPEEAALPPPINAPKAPLATRAITRRPDVILVSPEKDVTSPFNFQLKFHADSFHLTYLRNPTVDLTARVRTYVTAGGLEMAGAEAEKRSIKAKCAGLTKAST
jgi:hypothetical protein